MTNLALGYPIDGQPPLFVAEPCTLVSETGVVKGVTAFLAAEFRGQPIIVVEGTDGIHSGWPQTHRAAVGLLIVLASLLLLDVVLATEGHDVLYTIRGSVILRLDPDIFELSSSVLASCHPLKSISF